MPVVPGSDCVGHPAQFVRLLPETGAFDPKSGTLEQIYQVFLRFVIF
jgi:hypothetical protein